MIAERISYYRIVSKLGAGVMGEGYQAQDTNSIATLRVRFCWPGSLSVQRVIVPSDKTLTRAARRSRSHCMNCLSSKRSLPKIPDGSNVANQASRRLVSPFAELFYLLS
jgi:hypothetical protein